MGLLYVNENGAVMGVEANQCTVTYKDGMKRMIPIESLEAITIMGQSQMTTVQKNAWNEEYQYLIFLRVEDILDDSFLLDM